MVVDPKKLCLYAEEKGAPRKRGPPLPVTNSKGHVVAAAAAPAAAAPEKQGQVLLLLLLLLLLLQHLQPLHQVLQQVLLQLVEEVLVKQGPP